MLAIHFFLLYNPGIASERDGIIRCEMRWSGSVQAMSGRMTTLCYLERNGAYLMLHRVKKQQDENKDKWIGIGGKFEAGESPEMCLRREVLEETGYTLKRARFRGIVTFVSDTYGTEYMHLFTSEDFSGTEKVCDEGNLEWVPKNEIAALKIWEGDRIFLKLLAEDAGFFSLRLEYRGEELIGTELYRYDA